MPYDYPGDYAMRFDGVDTRPSAYFKRLSSPNGSLVLRLSPFGTFKIQDLTAATPRGAMLLQQWCNASSRGAGPAKNLVIEPLNRARLPVARWRVRNARPMKWALKPATGGTAKGEIAMESLEIAHEGIRPG